MQTIVAIIDPLLVSGGGRPNLECPVCGCYAEAAEKR